MVTVVHTYTNLGLQGHHITIEADMNKSLPTIDIIGLPDAAIKESKERIRATFRNTGVQIPPQKIILNLAPSDIRKVGTRFDLPMAMAILTLIYDNDFQDRVSTMLFFGELGLDGAVKRIDGLLPSVVHAMRKGYTEFVVPRDNLHELEYVQNIKIYPVSHFEELLGMFADGNEIEPLYNAKKVADLVADTRDFPVCFSDIKGQLVAKRALTVAAAGLHNMLMAGAPGSGKTMLAKALQSILPPMTFEEILEVSQIYSIVGKLTKEQPLVTQRPFRQVHHTASRISIVGGGRDLTPGEVSLAHKGILFFDELPEFPRPVLEVLRQPIEDKMIAISRVSGTVQYPANFMFVATMNPCKCGYYKDPDKPCTCSFHDIKRYQQTISGPLLDRIDMLLEVPREKIDTIMDASKGETSEQIQKRILQAWKIQQTRFKGTGIVANAHILAKDIDRYIPLGHTQKNFIKTAVQKLGISPRVMHRLMRVARTVADLDGSEMVEVRHLSEALQYRSKTMFIED